MVVSLSQSAKEGDDGYFGVPDDLGVVKKKDVFRFKIRSCSELKANLTFILTNA